MQIMAITALKDMRNVFYSGSPHMRESGKVLLAESGILVESGTEFKESRIRNPSSTTKNLEFSIHNPRLSSFPLHWAMW